MADGVDFNLVGVEELLGKLDSVKVDVRKRGGRFALRKAAQVVRDAARRNAGKVDDPATSEQISANIVERWSGRAFRRTGNPQFRVGVLGGARRVARAVGEISGAGTGNPGGDTYYWRFLEFGTEHMRAQPFLRRALSDNVSQASGVFVDEYSKAIDRAIKRAKKKAS